MFDFTYTEVPTTAVGRRVHLNEIVAALIDCDLFACKLPFVQPRSPSLCATITAVVYCSYTVISTTEIPPPTFTWLSFRLGCIDV